MKKTLAIVMAVIMAGSAFAQQGTIYVGATGMKASSVVGSGQLITGITYSKNMINLSSLGLGSLGDLIGGLGDLDLGDLGNLSGGTDIKATTFGIAPEVGYFYTDNLAFGVGLGLNYTSLSMGEFSSHIFTFGINPYARYYALNFDKFSLYLQGGFSFTSSKMKDVDAATVFYMGIKPGLAYNLNENFSVNFTFGDFGYTNYGDDQSTFELQLSPSTLAFGLTYSL